MSERRSRIAAGAGGLGAAALVLALLGPGLSNLGVVEPVRGFQLFLLGLLLGILALIAGVVGVGRTRAGSGRGGRPLAWAGVAVGLALVALLVATGRPAFVLPPINDITTDPDDPPEFRAARGDPANRGRDLGYPAAFAALQREAYPDLSPIALEVAPDPAFARARTAARSLGWEIVEVRTEARELEARHASAVFRFVDDLVVRVRPDGDGSRIDVRSKSRDGRGDLGANASRIRRFREAVR